MRKWEPVTIITVCRNSAKYLEATIKSVISQKGVEVDYVVIDGESTDGTLEIIRRYESEIGYWSSEPDRSMYHAINKGIRAAKGAIVGIVNSDDQLYDCYTLQDIVREFDELTDEVGVYGDQLKVAGDNERYKKVFQVDYYDYLIAGKGTFVPHGSLFIKRSVIEELGGYDEEFLWASDYDFILRCMCFGRLRYVPMPVSMFRVHGESITASGRLPSDRDAVLRKHEVHKMQSCWASLRRYLLWTKYWAFQVTYAFVWPAVRARRRWTLQRRTRDG